MRDLRAIAGWLIGELRAAAGFLREPALWIALIAGLALWVLAYQWPGAHRLDIGGNLASGRREDDRPYLRGFNGSEPDPLLITTTTTFRWAEQDAMIALPGIGGGVWATTLRMSSGRPDGSAVVSRLDDGTRTSVLSLTGTARVYRLLTQASGAGDLTLRLTTPPYHSPTDPRSLGMVVYRVEIAPVAGVRIPASGQLALLTLSLALAYALMRRLLLMPRAALAVTLAVATTLALLLAFTRPALTLFTPTLAALLAACYILGLVLDALLYRYPPSSILHPPSSIFVVGGRWSVVILIVVAFGIRLGGILHPHAIFSDIGLNTHNLLDVNRGNIYFTERLPGEAGGRPAPYPPGQYLLLAPAQLLLPTIDDPARELLLKIGNALWDSLVVGLLWFVLGRGGWGPRTAWLGAALYIVPPPLLSSFSIGELANIFGQGLALPLLGLLALRAHDLARPRVFAVALALLALALLGHLGVTISLAVLLGCLGLVWLARAETRRAGLILAGLVVLAALLAGLGYYSVFGDLLATQFTPAEATAPGAVAASSAGERLVRLVQRLFQPNSLLSPLALVAGVLGAGLVTRRPRRSPCPATSALGSLLIAWWCATLLSLALLLFAGQGVRWQHFLYPALCLGGGPLLAALSARGRAGRVVAGATLGFLLWYGVAFWVTQVANYLH